MNQDFMTIYHSRRSIRRYQDKTISREDLLSLLKEAVQSPSSRNIQPWSFVVVDSQAAKAKLEQLVLTNTQQVATAAASIIIYANDQQETRAQPTVKAGVSQGVIAPEKEAFYVERLIQLFTSAPQAKKQALATMDIGILVGHLILVAKAKGYDTNIIGGFDREQVAQAFPIQEPGSPAIIVTVGYADEEPKATYRQDVAELTRFE